MQHGVGGGMEVHEDILCTGLVDRGHSVTIITTRHPEGIEYEEKEGVKIYYLKKTTPELYSRQWWKESTKKFEELQKEEKFDVIWSQSSAGRLCAKKFKAKYNLPFLLVSHGTWLKEIQGRFNRISSIRNILGFFMKELPQNIYRYLFWDFKFMRDSDAIIAVSKEVAKAIQKQYFINFNKIYVVYNGVDVSLFRPSRENRRIIRKKYGISEDEKVLLLLGKIEKAKGMHLAIQAIPRVIKYFSDVKLLIVGKGPYLKTLETLADRLDVLKNVIFCGYVPNKETPSYYNACDIYLNPTLLIESCPFVTIEALATGKPVIASRIGAINSIIDDEETGLLIKPGDFKDLARKIIRLLKEERLANKISKNAREKALREFNQENMIENTVKVFEKVIKEKKNK
jgi:glycosyltransferase involved in cell wall biosynthesis